jgi:LytR cell envelope-related transcriptional attenuator
VSSDNNPERYRRRNRWPAVGIIGVLLLLMAATWVVVLQPAPAVDMSCNQPGPAPSASSTSGAAGDTSAGATDTSAATDTAAAGTSQNVGAPASPVATVGVITDKNTLKDTRPASPATVQVRVVNASSTAGMARTVTEAWRKAGFESIKDAADDSLYPAKDLRCFGEIRYGAAGSPAARTVLIVAPCATLVLDDRLDDSVEFSIGAAFEDSAITADQQALLDQITRDSTPPAVLEGATQAVPTAAPIPPLPTATCPA